jgi:hypothetical protein
MTALPFCFVSSRQKTHPWRPWRDRDAIAGIDDPAGRGSGPFNAFSQRKSDLDGKLTVMPPWRLHDLRRSVRSTNPCVSWRSDRESSTMAGWYNSDSIRIRLYRYGAQC